MRIVVIVVVIMIGVSSVVASVAVSATEAEKEDRRFIETVDVSGLTSLANSRHSEAQLALRKFD